MRYPNAPANDAARAVSLPEVYRSVSVPAGAGVARKLFAFSGPGFLVAVGYMDPGNWATAIAGGSAFGYTLLSVVMIANLIAIVLQALSARLGIATGQDLAQACREHYSRPVAWVLWVLAELAICATDLAEVIGTAIALNLLFGIPLAVGVLITAADVLLILLLQARGFRYMEALIISLIVMIAGCFGYEIVLSNPDWAAVAAGFVPSREIISNPQMLYLAIGILGATVMPHNLYLHSSIVQTRRFEEDSVGKQEAVRYATIDSTIALMFALLINAAILIVAAAAFHTSGHSDITEIQDAYRMLTPVLGAGAASVVFALALLASGQNSAVTGTLAGQIVMEGFLRIRLPAWARRMITRLVAIFPAVVVAVLYGEQGTAHLLILSQVILSLQLPFAIVPLVRFTSDRAKMGELVAPRWVSAIAWTMAVMIIALNVKLIADFPMR
ncbi:MAG: Nramp family divalent metal transporter [Burkholderiales bacterium]